VKRNRGSGRSRAALHRNVSVLALAVASGFATAAPTSVWANPTGGNVVAGSPAITSAGKSLTINQSTNRAIVNWQGFSIGAGETTRINLPSSVSAILNRVTGANPSLIAGSLSSNGQVYLINPNGIVVGPNGRINTGGFVASTSMCRTTPSWRAAA
jgi:filamentous hemagglutinin family protein